MLIWIDGFEGYKTAGYFSNDALLTRRYAAAGGAITYVSINPGRVTGLSLGFGWEGNNWIQTPSLTTNATLLIGAAFKTTTTFSSYTTALFAFYDGALMGMNLRLTPAGELAVYYFTTLLKTSTGAGLVLNQWSYIEFKVVCNSTTGSYDVRVDGVSVLSDSGINTQIGSNVYYDSIRLNATTSYMSLDDLYICDGSGGSHTNFLGPCRTLVSNPDGDNSVNWSTVYPALTDHYADVDDGTIADDDATYVEDNTTGHRDLFDYASISTLTDIFGVAIHTTCKVTDVIPVDIKTVIESNGDEEISAALTMSSTDYRTISYISETDPHTSLAWDVTNLNDAHFGFEVG